MPLLQPFTTGCCDPRPSDYDLWLDPSLKDTTAISDLLKPFDASRMRCYPVSSHVNQVTNDDEACVAPVEVADAQTGLF
jgi:putative SOS response-associated peptidase YedK